MNVRRRLPYGLAALAAIACATAPAATAATTRASAGWIVVLKHGSAQTPRQAAASARAQGADVRFVYTRALRGFSATLPAALLSTLRASADVDYIAPNVRVHADGTQSNPPSYGLDRIDQRALPLNSTYVYPRTGLGVDAYGIDTGIRITHQQFGGRARYGYDAIDGSLPADDCNGHGTHTAGTMGGSETGVAKQVSLIAVRVLDCDGSGAADQIIAGINWIIGDHQAGKPAVANISIGTNLGTSTPIDDAVRAMIADGVTTAIAAGNGLGNGLYPVNACNTSPARVTQALTVSNTDSTDTRSFEANTGSCVDLFAPGTGIVSTWNSSDTATQSDSGTSMAAPHVAGASALYLEANPSATPAQVAAAIIGNATTGVVKNPGSGTPNRLLYVGFIPAGSGGNASPVASFTSACTGLSCSFTDTSTDADGSIASRSWNFGDGATSTATNPAHAYAAGGSYTVTLTVTDNGGATATTTRTVTVTAPGGDPDPGTPTLTSGVATTGTNAAAGAFVYYKVAVPSGSHSVKLDLTGPACGVLGLNCNPDLDLYGRIGSKPTTAASDCTSQKAGSTETCTITTSAAGYVYVGVYTYSGSAGKQFTVKATVT